MICAKCHVGYMTAHPERKFAVVGWLKCPTCGFCCQELKVVRCDTPS